MGNTDAERDKDGNSRDLWQRIVSSYAFALQQGAVYKTNTNTEFLQDETLGVPFILQVAEALRDKPPANKKRYIPFLCVLYIRGLAYLFCG